MTDAMPPPAFPAPPTHPAPALAVPPPGPPDAQPDDARIYDRGYRRYDGERTGVAGSLRTLIRHSIRHALGLGRSARFKVLPALIVIFAYLPAVAIIGVVALFPIDPSDFLPTYAEYYGFVTAAIYLFVALIGPLLLCSDRRNGLLGVYLAAALNRPLYLLGKAIAVTVLLLLVTLGPPLLLLVALTLQNLGPDGFTAWIETLGQIIASSLILGILFAAVAMAISSTTDRTIIASVSVLATILGSTIVTATMVDGIGLHPAIRLGDLLVLPQALIFRISDQRGVWPVRDNPTWTIALAWLGWVSACVGWTWFRYRRLLVRR